MLGLVGFVLVVVAYLVWRFSYNVRAVKARRAGDRDRADALRTKGMQVFLGTAAALTIGLVILAAVAIARG